ncbi:hypothetical protein MMC18_004142 [Xylographa bjoerkii]|nr:hypothetical protein [Xylographa bjoerkii]
MNSASKPARNQGGSPSKSLDGEQRTQTQVAPPQVLLTFGVELEFLYQYDESYQSELEKLGSDLGIHLAPDDEEMLVYEIVAKILSSNQIPVNTVMDFRHNTDDKWTVMIEDIDSTYYDAPNSRRVEIEITSRILVLEEKSFEEVRLVLALLENFPGPYKFYVNRFAGFHVHVGAQQEKFILPWLKKFTQTVTAFEHEIESLHSDDRIQNTYAQPPSQLPTLLPRDGPVTSLGVLEMQKTFEDLKGTFINESRYKAYNFEHLIDPDSYPSNTTRRKQTIEFRQHAGTLDADTICNWIEFVCALIKYTFRADHRENLAFLMNHLKRFPDTTYSIEDLMRKIGVPHLFAWYRDSGRIHDRDRVSLEDLPYHDPSIEVPNVQPLWDLLRDAESGVEVEIGVKGVKRGWEKDGEDEEQEPTRRRLFERGRRMLR